MRVRGQPGPGNRLYGARKTWRELNAAGIGVARCTVGRLMRELGIAGVGRPAKKPRATVPAGTLERPADLLDRDFGATAPNARWVVDITYVPTRSGWCYTAFVMDLYSRAIAGWAVADHLRPDSPPMRWRWESGGGKTASAGLLSTIPIAACNIRRSAIPIGWTRSVPSVRVQG